MSSAAPPGSPRDSRLLTRSDLVALLTEVGVAAQQRGVRVEMFVVGGGAIALVYSDDRVTTDLDAVFEPKMVAYELAALVAGQHPELDIPPNWLNDGVKGLLLGDDPAAVETINEPGIRVSVASPRYLFQMKALANRESDLDDLRLLYRLAGYGNAEEALNDVERAAGQTQRLRPSIRYVVEGLAAEQKIASTDISETATEPESKRFNPFAYLRDRITTKRSKPAPQTTHLRPLTSPICGAVTTKGTRCLNQASSCPHHR